MSAPPLLSAIIFFPVIGAFFISCIRGDGNLVAHNSRQAALLTSGIVFCLALFLWLRFDPDKGLQFVEYYTWVPQFFTRYHLGVDGISLFFVLLTAFLIPLCILASWQSIKQRVKEYMILFLLLETFLLGAFLALDLILFYIFFEGVLIPMVLIIGIWGSEQRIYSAFKFFLYTMLGSVLMLIGILAIYYNTGTTDLDLIRRSTFTQEMHPWIWLAFFIAFAIKIPMWPLHTWLPDAHTEAPTTGSVMLAGVLLKMGGYGFLRFLLPLFPQTSVYYTPMVVSVSLVAIIYTSLVCLVQKDIKKLIAYSSIAHMGLVTLGLFTGNHQAIVGAIFLMLSHGLVSAALFLCVGIIYDRCHTREIRAYGGLVKCMPVYAFFFMLFTLSSIGLPGTSSFVGEFLIILGTFKFSMMAACIAATTIVLSAAYGLWLYRRIIFDGLNPQLDIKALKDLTWREKVVFASIACVVMLGGLKPQIFLKTIDPAVKNFLTEHSSRSKNSFSLHKKLRK